MADSFVFYRSFDEVIAQIPEPETQLKFYKAIVDYGLNDTTTDFPYPLNLLFIQMCASISSAKVKHDKRVEAGRNGGKKSKGGGAPKGNQNAKAKTTSKQQATTSLSLSKQQANDNVNDNVNVNDNDNVNLHIVPAVCAPLDAAQPSVRWEVRQDENGETRFVKIEHGGGTT